REAGDPQPPEHAFADPAVPEGVDAGPDERHFRLADEVVPALAKTLGQAAETLPPPQHSLAAACACHGSGLPTSKAAAAPSAISNGWRLGLTHHANVGLGNLGGFGNRAAELAFALARLVTEQVFFARLAAFQLAGRGDAEALADTLVGLHLGHRSHRSCFKAKRKAPGQHQGSRPWVAKPDSQFWNSYYTKTGERGEGGPTLTPWARASPSGA